MNYGLYISASGVMTNLYRLDVAANNLANLETPGFKPDTATMRMRPAYRQETGSTLPSNALLERLGAGVKAGPTATKFGQGSVETTGRPLDVALMGEGFLVVQGAGSRRGDAGVRLTRDGRMALNGKQQLVMASTGLPVLDTDGKPITLAADGRPVTFDLDGTVRQGNAPVAKLDIAAVPEQARLRKEGQGLFAVTSGQWARRAEGTASVQGKSIERSGVDPVQMMLEVGRAERAVGENTRMIQLRDELTQRAISTFARIG